MEMALGKQVLHLGWLHKHACGKISARTLWSRFARHVVVVVSKRTRTSSVGHFEKEARICLSALHPTLIHRIHKGLASYQLSPSLGCDCQAGLGPIYIYLSLIGRPHLTAPNLMRGI